MITKHGTPIRDLDDWADRAGPKRRDQWTEDRSAMEAARAWLRVKPPSLPREIELLLSTSSAFSEVLSWEAEPEVPVPFDSFRGERPSTVQTFLPISYPVPRTQQETPRWCQLWCQESPAICRNGGLGCCKLHLQPLRRRASCMGRKPSVYNERAASPSL